MLKQIFHKDVLLIILVNLLFIDFTWQFPFIVVTLLLFTLDSYIIDVIFLNFILLFLILRLTVLPFIYNYMEYNSNNIIVQKLIVKLKKTNFAKLLMLVMTLIPTFTYFAFKCRSLLEFVKKIPFMFAICIIIGAFGSYIALFLYWYISKNFNKNVIVRKILDITASKYVFFVFIAFNILMYLINIRKIIQYQ